MTTGCGPPEQPTTKKVANAIKYVANLREIVFEVIKI